jgi:hypothetical protein
MGSCRRRKSTLTEPTSAAKTQKPVRSKVGRGGTTAGFAGEIRDAFAEGWMVESVEPSRFETRPDMKDLKFSDGGPKSWSVVVRRR